HDLNTLDIFLPVHTILYHYFFFQAEDGIRDATVTGVQTCALPICGLERVQQREVHGLAEPIPPIHEPFAQRPTDGVHPHAAEARSEERREGKECRSRWSTDH